MGLLATMSAVGTASGTPLGGLLTTMFGWRSVFLVNLPLGIVALVLVFMFVPSARATPMASGARFDLVGTILLAGTLTAYALAMTVGDAAAGQAGMWLLAAAVAGTAVFVFSQARVPWPLIRLTAFRDPDLGAGLFNNIVIMMAATMSSLVGPFYLSGAIGLNAALVGLVMAIGPVTAVLGSVAMGRVVDRFGTSRIVFAGLVLAAAGLLVVTILPAGYGLAGFIVGLAVFSLGYIAFVVANNTAIMSGAGPGDRGVVSGMLNLARNLGSITAAAALGALFARASGTADVALAAPAALIRGTRVTFAASAAIIAVSIAITAVLAYRRRPAGAKLDGW
jgi:MFS family permease